LLLNSAFSVTLIIIIKEVPRVVEEVCIVIKEIFIRDLIAYLIIIFIVRIVTIGLVKINKQLRVLKLKSLFLFAKKILASSIF
jgi:hypothetical protein